MRLSILWFVAVVALFALGASLYVLQKPPMSFPTGQRVEIPSGTSLAGSARILESARIIQSSPLLQLIVIAKFRGEGVKAGVYQFDQPLSIFSVADAIINGTNMAPLVHVTIPEGLRNAQIDTIVSEQLPGVEPGIFSALTEGKEGYLFPETYHVPETFTTEEFVALMEKTFNEKRASLAPTFDASARSPEDIIIMASILEREADSKESMQLISGVLWKRIDMNMPLQVDASFSYLLGKTSGDITLDDLQIDSPYNTYKYRGLPPTPLNNPGLQAIEAALSPIPSAYLYYLTGNDGVFHYAETFEEHTKNKELYLR